MDVNVFAWHSQQKFQSVNGDGAMSPIKNLRCSLRTIQSRNKTQSSRRLRGQEVRFAFGQYSLENDPIQRLPPARPAPESLTLTFLLASSEQRTNTIRYLTERIMETQYVSYRETGQGGTVTTNNVSLWLAPLQGRTSVENQASPARSW